MCSACLKIKLPVIHQGNWFNSDLACNLLIEQILTKSLKALGIMHRFEKMTEGQQMLWIFMFNL